MEVYEFKVVRTDMRYPDRVTDTAVVSIQTGSLSEVLDAFERFLRASGFVFDGEIVIDNSEFGVCDDEDEAFERSEDSALPEPSEEG